jgi:hypothetical protein
MLTIVEAAIYNDLAATAAAIDGSAVVAALRSKKKRRGTAEEAGGRLCVVDTMVSEHEDNIAAALLLIRLASFTMMKIENSKTLNNGNKMRSQNADRRPCRWLAERAIIFFKTVKFRLNFGFLHISHFLFFGHSKN